MQDFLSEYYLYTKSLHLISLFAWMAGIFYLPRLYVYHVEKAADRPDLAKIYEEMERKLLRAIMNPAMIAAWIFGLALVMTPGVVDWSSGWPWVKATLVIALTWYHHVISLWRKDLAAGRNVRSGRFYRIANEVPTLIMVGIVFMVVTKPF